MKFYEQIAWMLYSRSPSISLMWPDVAHQTGSHACGLFALANAFALCSGIQPEDCAWDQPKMWHHLSGCIDEGILTMPPCTSSVRQHAGIIHQEEERVYCLCRQPALRNRFMIQCMTCKEWFHRGCERIPRLVNKSTIYNCSLCLK